MEEVTKIVVVRWVDSHSHMNAWTDDSTILPDKDDGVMIVSAGVLLEETDDWVRITHTKAYGKHYGSFSIPKGCVRSMDVVANINYGD